MLDILESCISMKNDTINIVRGTLMIMKDEGEEFVDVVWETYHRWSQGKRSFLVMSRSK